MTPLLAPSGPPAEFTAPEGVKPAPPAWFATPERLERLRASAQSWVGTPFFPHGQNKGPQGGVSCQTLVALVYREAGFVPPGWAIPVAPLAFCFQPMVDTVEKELAAHFARVEALAPGDLICFRLRRQGHLGIALDARRFVHCLREGGVMLSRLDDATYLHGVARLWRPVTAI